LRFGGCFEKAGQVSVGRNPLCYSGAISRTWIFTMEVAMSKYLIQASYSSEGLKGAMKDKASGRKAVIEKALASVGGKLDAMYYAFGDYDVVLIADAPDNLSVAALNLNVCSSGLARTRTTPLLTIEETDKAMQKAVSYQAPGK
jgi:uncharacterized protein with GYD domain